MKKVWVICSMYVFLAGHCFSQTKKIEADKKQIKANIVGFLSWYKLITKDAPIGSYTDTTIKDYQHLASRELKQSGFLSDNYIEEFKRNWEQSSKVEPSTTVSTDLIKTADFDGDIVLMTREPEMILNNIKKGQFNGIYIIYNKALVALKISRVVHLLFTLTKERNGKWLIDYIGYDNHYKYNLATQ